MRLARELFTDVAHFAVDVVNPTMAVAVAVAVDVAVYVAVYVAVATRCHRSMVGVRWGVR